MELKLGIWIICLKRAATKHFYVLKKSCTKTIVLESLKNRQMHPTNGYLKRLSCDSLPTMVFAAHKVVWVWDPCYKLNDYFQLCHPVVPTSKVITARSRPARRSPSTALRSSPSRRQSSTFTSMTKMLVKPVRIFKM